MAGIRPTELPRMRHVQFVHQHDTCEHLVYGSVLDAYNLPVATWAVIATMSCGYNPDPHREVQGETMVVEYDAELRMPVSWQPNEKDRVRITHIHGELVHTPALFDLVGVGERGPTAVVHKLKKVLDGGI